MNQLLLNHVISFGLISIILPAIATFVYFKNRARTLNVAFALYTLSIGWWAFFTIFMITSTSPGWGLFWDRMCLTGTVFIPSTLFHFVIAYAKGEGRYRKLIKFNYAVSITFLLALWTTRLFVRDVIPKFGMNFFTVPGPLYGMFIVFFFECVIVAVSSVWFFYRSVTDRKIKRQARLLFWFSVIGYTGGGCNYFLVYDIALPGVAESSNYGVLFLSISIAYIIFKYQFLDIQVIIRRTLVFAGLFSFVFGIFSAVSFLIQIFLEGFLSVGFSTGISVFVIVLTYDRLRNYLMQVTDRYLFQKKVNYRSLLRDGSQFLARLDSLHRQARFVIAFLTKKARIENAAIYVFTARAGILGLQACRPRIAEKRLQSIRTFHPLIQHLYNARNAVLLQDILEERKGETVPRVRSELDEIISLMEALKAEAVIPCFGSDVNLGFGRTRPHLRGILFLGHQKSDEPYSHEDLDVFFTLAQESSIAFQNARLYDEAVERTHELQRINAELNTASTRLMKSLSDAESARKELEENKALLVEMKRRENLERLAASIGHELNNPLGVFTLKRMEFQYAVNKLQKEITAIEGAVPAERSQALNAIIGQQNVLLEKFGYFYERMRAVANTVNSLIKAQDEISSVSLRMVLDYSFEEVRFITYTENLSGTEIELDVSTHLPPIRGNAYELQAVFVNLIVNAYHAMIGTSRRKIIISAAAEPGGEMVRVTFRDNGKGMPKHVLEKCFEYRYTTKGESGTGIGLTVCKQTVERHDGSIAVDSVVGQGTTFTLRLPVWKAGDEAKYYKSPFDRLKERQAAERRKSAGREPPEEGEKRIA